LTAFVLSQPSTLKSSGLPSFLDCQVFWTAKSSGLRRLLGCDESGFSAGRPLPHSYAHSSLHAHPNMPMMRCNISRVKPVATRSYQALQLTHKVAWSGILFEGHLKASGRLLGGLVGLARGRKQVAITIRLLRCHRQAPVYGVINPRPYIIIHRRFSKGGRRRPACRVANGPIP
jgi:hypothetical protein